MSKIIEVKDPYTAGHQQRVSQLAVSISKELNLPQEQVEGIRTASLIHDIGKIAIPTEILSKSTVLTDIEFNLIKEHSQIGHDILKSIDFAYPIAQIVLQHHERINGLGYPNQLKGDEILLEDKNIRRCRCGRSYVFSSSLSSGSRNRCRPGRNHPKQRHPL